MGTRALNAPINWDLSALLFTPKRPRYTGEIMDDKGKERRRGRRRRRKRKIKREGNGKKRDECHNASIVRFAIRIKPNPALGLNEVFGHETARLK